MGSVSHDLECICSQEIISLPPTSSYISTQQGCGLRHWCLFTLLTQSNIHFFKSPKRLFPFFCLITLVLAVEQYECALSVWLKFLSSTTSSFSINASFILWPSLAYHDETPRLWLLWWHSRWWALFYQLEMQPRRGGAVLSQPISCSQKVISPLFVIILLGMQPLYFCFVTCHILGHCLSLLCVAVINIITKMQLGKKRVYIIL